MAEITLQISVLDNKENCRKIQQTIDKSEKP